MILIYYVIINIVTFVLFGADKFFAVGGHWRISEKTLLGLVILGGVVGGYFGMKKFRHKTKKSKFRFVLAIAIVIHLYFIKEYI